MKDILFATATLIGTIVGLGMFGIPYTVSKAGFFVGILYLLALGAVFIVLHLIQGEIANRDSENHRLTGFVEKYLGKTWKKAIGAMIILSAYSALLAYIIVGGKFLSSVFGNFLDPRVMSLIFWLILSVCVWFGLKTIGEIELVMTGLLLLFVVILFFAGSQSIDFQNFPKFNLPELFLPYGVILFAYSGFVAIPEIRGILKNDAKKLKFSIIAGSLIPIVVYIIFTVTVVGVSGIYTTEEAIKGLERDLGSLIAWIGSAFGVLAIATSYLVLGVNLKNTFENDWKLRKDISGFLTTFIPIFLFIALTQDFIKVISFAGAVIGAPIAISVILIYNKAIKSGGPALIIKVPKFIQWTLIALFALGGLYEIIYLSL